jgi:hypothetical protein
MGNRLGVPPHVARSVLCRYSRIIRLLLMAQKASPPTRVVDRHQVRM